jgi:MFS family permease
MKSFEADYGYDEATETRTGALAVGLQQLGAFVGCFVIWPVTARLGRRFPLILASLIFCIGAAIQTIPTGSLNAFYVARVIAGVGLGGATVIVPLYSSEMAPKELRGQIGSFLQLFFTIVWPWWRRNE